MAGKNENDGSQPFLARRDLIWGSIARIRLGPEPYMAPSHIRHFRDLRHVPPTLCYEPRMELIELMDGGRLEARKMHQIPMSRTEFYEGIESLNVITNSLRAGF